MSRVLLHDVASIVTGALRVAARTAEARLERCASDGLAPFPRNAPPYTPKPSTSTTRPVEEVKESSTFYTPPPAPIQQSAPAPTRSTFVPPPPAADSPPTESTLDSKWLQSSIPSPSASKVAQEVKNLEPEPVPTITSTSPPETPSHPIETSTVEPTQIPSPPSEPVSAFVEAVNEKVAPIPSPPEPEVPAPPASTPEESVKPFIPEAPPTVFVEETVAAPIVSEILPGPRAMKASTVPSSRLGRLFHYGGLAVGLSYGAASEAVRRVGSSGENQSSLMMSEANVRRLVDKLGRMRGAALKLGQFLSIQDSKLLPKQVEQIMMEVQNNANYMPEWQTEKVLTTTLGSSWRSHFATFDSIPFAAASIGQVHRGTLSPESPLVTSGQYPANLPLAIKVQFPGVRSSIGSDLANLKWLLVAGSVLPRGLYLENTLRVMKRELDEECDYMREARCGARMKELLKKTKEGGGFDAPRVVEELCGEMVLTTEMMEGEPLTKAIDYAQEKRDKIGEDVLKLCLRELFHFKFMQTDPNWSNFLFNKSTRKIELIDFGATRTYTQAFIDKFYNLLMAAIDEDREKVLQVSRDLGYLTGEENEEMLTAHVASVIALGIPFRSASPSPFPFATEGAAITLAIRAQIPIMLKHRLTPPPEETYSLNRKLSGAFLLCERLGSNVNARKILEEVQSEMQGWRGENEELEELRRMD